MPLVDSILTLLHDYWEAAFEAEWHRLEPVLHDAITHTGRQIAAGGVFPMLSMLIPQIRIDPAQRLMRLDRPHDHDISVSREHHVTFTASHYVWPHVRVTCDEPWPLRVTYPTAPLGPARPTASREDVLTVLRALAAAPRIQIAEALARQSRATQELASALGLSESVISRHLQQMSRAGLVTSRREGYYVIYSLDQERFEDVGMTLARLASGVSE
jgi:DNA-binding transcriptional ArsR family regulator